MAPQIEVSETTYNRLESLAEGFDTPERVIERLLSAYEGKPLEYGSSRHQDNSPRVLRRPDPEFYPSNINEFKKLLIKNKQAYRLMTFADGRTEMSLWNASRIDEDSDILGNIYSGVLRGWKQKSIVRAQFAIEQADLSSA